LGHGRRANRQNSDGRHQRKNRLHFKFLSFTGPQSESQMGFSMEWPGLGFASGPHAVPNCLIAQPFRAAFHRMLPLRENTLPYGRMDAEPNGKTSSSPSPTMRPFRVPRPWHSSTAVWGGLPMNGASSEPINSTLEASGGQILFA
jgi:hypothetical protein